MTRVKPNRKTRGGRKFVLKNAQKMFIESSTAGRAHITVASITVVQKTGERRTRFRQNVPFVLSLNLFFPPSSAVVSFRHISLPFEL